MAKDFYKVLGVDKSAKQEEIKKAYRKQAMKFHPDRNKGNKQAEENFKEVGEAYATLGDENKRKSYDMFGATSGGNPFGGGARGGGTYSASDLGGFEDIFSGFGGGQQSQGSSFDFSDLFGQSGGFGGKSQSQSRTKAKEAPIDLEHTYEVPIFDLLLGCSIEVKGDNKKTVKLKIPQYTKPGTKFRVKGLGKNIGGIQGNLIVQVEAKMPKNISEVDISLLERIRENTGY